MRKNLKITLLTRCGFACLLAISGMLVLPAGVYAKPPVVGVYLTIPSKVSLPDDSHRTILIDVNDRIFGMMAGFFSQYKLANPRIISQDILSISADEEKIKIDPDSLVERFMEKEKKKSYFSKNKIDYMIVGKFQYLHTDVYNVYWNVVKVEQGTPVAFVAEQPFRSQKRLDISEFIAADDDENGNDIVDGIYSNLLSYIDRSQSILTRTNIVFCSCFDIDGSDEVRELAKDIINFLPVKLMDQLKEKMKSRNLEFKYFGTYGDRFKSMLKKSACNEINTIELRDVVTITVSPDYYISGRIMNNNDDEVTVYAGIDRPRRVGFIPSYELDAATRRNYDVEGFAEEIAFSIKKQWEKMIEELHGL